MRKDHSKKIITVIAAAVMALSLTACGSSSAAASQASSQPVQSEAQAVETTDAAQSAAATDSASSVAAADTSAASQTPVTVSVTSSGSSSILPLAQSAAESFMEKNPDCIITTNGGGSGTGLKEVAAGTVDIGDSDVFAEEKLDADTAKGLVDHEVCTITMAPVVNKSLGVTNLTTDQLVAIFTGKTTNWKEVGGPDKDIVLVSRPDSSGTRALFKKWALGGAEEASNKALETDDSGTLLQTVEDNDAAIGYVALSYLVNNDKVQAVGIDGVEPTLENTNNGTYKVWGYEHMYTKGEGTDAAKAFIEYISGDEYADSLESMGYGVTAKLSTEAAAAHK